METVLIIVCLIVALMALIACVAMVRSLVALKHGLSDLTKQLGKLESELDKQDLKIRQLTTALAPKPHGNVPDLLPVLGALANAKGRGVLPTLVVLSWKLLAAYLKNRGAHRQPKRTY